MKQGMKNALGIAAGMAVIVLGDVLLGAKIEVFSGIATFTPVWVLDVFLVPFLSGMAVSRVVQTRNGKWLACLPPLFVRCLTYLYMYLYVFNDGRDFFYNLNLFYWGPTVILVVEFANLGGILGDVLAGSYRAKKVAPSDREG
jgi:hypothetical protein